MIGWDGRQVTLLMRDFDKPLGLAAAGNGWCWRRGTICAFSPTRHFGPRISGESTRTLRRPVFAARDVSHGRFAHARRGGFGRGDNLGRHAIFLPGAVEFRFQFRSRLEAAVCNRSGARGSLPSERNGGCRDGRPRYVTALGTTDAAGAWRENKAAGGVVIDVATDEISDARSVHAAFASLVRRPVMGVEFRHGRIARGRSRKAAGTTWCARLPGYLRGLCFVGPYAVVGLSKIREKHIFGGLPVQSRCAAVAMRRGGCRPSQRRGGRLFRIHRRLRRTVRRAIFARPEPPDDPEPGEAGGAPGDQQSGLVVSGCGRAVRSARNRRRFKGIVVRRI